MPGFSDSLPFLLLLFDVQSYLFGRTGVSADRTVFYAGCDLLKSRHCIVEELPVTFAEIALSHTVVVVPAEPVFHASATAYIEMFAYETLITKVLFVPSEGSLFTVVGQFL